MKNWKLTIAFSAFALMFAQGCANEATSNKGEEEEALAVDGKADSFFRPTERGTLTFGVANSGTITSDARFHSWTFELSEKAEVAVTTSIDTPNLDTVMYLYTREDDSQTWGRYIAKNDDHKGNIWSQISKTLEAGQYRVIVKAYKKAMTGKFQVSGTCEGPGCPVVKECNADTAASLPTETDFDAGCASSMFRVLSTPVTTTNSRSMMYVDKCDFPEVEALAADQYVDYWSVYVGDITDIFGFDSEEEIELFLHVAQHGDAGYSVTVDVGGDEDALTFIYDADLNPLTVYWHNQSPISESYCGTGGDAQKMHEDCLSHLMERAEEVTSEGKEESGTVTVGEFLDDLRVQAAVDRFAADKGIEAGTSVIWSRDGGLTINVASTETSVDYVVGDRYLFMIVEDGVPTSVCQNLE